MNPIHYQLQRNVDGETLLAALAARLPLEATTLGQKGWRLQYHEPRRLRYVRPLPATTLGKTKSAAADVTNFVIAAALEFVVTGLPLPLPWPDRQPNSTADQAYVAAAVVERDGAEAVVVEAVGSGAAELAKHTLEALRGAAIAELRHAARSAST